MSRLFKELKRRNVFRVAVAYMVIGWLLLQVADTLGPLLEIPEVFNKLLFYILLTGFVPTLLFSWVFELTPEGIKREKNINRDESITHLTAKKLDYLTLASLLLVTTLTLWQQFDGGAKASGPELKMLPTKQDVPLEKPARDDNATTAPLALGVAVLPFENLSADSNNHYFASGVHEDVLTQLAKIEELRVISRTSMVTVAKRGYQASEIGRYLGVSHVLEGSVRRDGNRVRVTVQLIDAANDRHIWAERFDRKLDDIFSIQSEIAISIAKQLRAKITPAQFSGINQDLTVSTEAYDLFNQAREISRVWRQDDGFKEMRPLLETALTIDPNFLQAEVLLVEVYGRLFWVGSDLTGVYKDKAQALLEKIKQNYPDTSDYFKAKGSFHYTVERNYELALTEYQKALLDKPNDVDLLSYIANCFKRLNRFDESIRVWKKAIKLDPDNELVVNELIGLIGTSGDHETALAMAKNSVDRFPKNMVGKVNLAIAYIANSGDKEKALKILETMPLKERYQYFDIYFALKLTLDNVDSLVEDLESVKEEDPWQVARVDAKIAILRSLVGQKDLARVKARQVLEFVEQWSATGKPMIGNTHKQLYASLSLLSCIADDKELFERYSERMYSTPAAEYYTKRAAQVRYAFALAECDDTEAAWLLIKDFMEYSKVDLINDWALATYPIFGHYFSEVPEFQARLARLEQEKIN